MPVIDLWLLPYIDLDLCDLSRLKNKKALVHLGRSGEKWGRVVMNGTDGDIPPNAG